MAVAPPVSPIHFEELIALTSNNDVLFDFLRRNNVLFDFGSDCARCGHGRLYLRRQKSVLADGVEWRCSNKRCTCKISFRKHSFFSGSKLSIAQITKIIYFWAHRYPQEIVIYETGIGTHAAVDFYNFLREVCCVILQEQSEAIGGPGKFVEIDESKFGKRKYNRGKRVEGIWVFGGIERHSNPPKCFFVPVQDRSADTLIPIIKQWIKPGTTILSDCWKAYHSLKSEGYIHRTVNHSIEFVTDKGVHTNNIESRWNAVKKSLPRYGTTKVLYYSYFAEYCIRRKFVDNAQDKFLETLRLVSLVYNPNRATDNQPQPAPEPIVPEPEPQVQPQPAELLAEPNDNNGAVEEQEGVVEFRPIDLPTFDLNFSMSDCSDSCDMFE